VSGLLLVIVSAWLSGIADPGWALALFIVGFGLFGVASGFGGLVFTEVMAKTTPKEKRGSYFGWRAIISGVTGFFLGIWVIKPIFALNSDPLNYIISFSIGTALIALSFYLFLQQREPVQTNLPPVRTLRVQLTKARRILLVDRRFRRMIFFRAALMIWFAGIPYYVLFATEHLAYRKGAVGIFTSWEFAGAIIANPLWSYLSNRIGNKTLLVVICVLAVLVSAAMLLFIAGVIPASFFGVIFLASAAVDSGAGTGGINYALEIVPEGERPTYIGLMNTLLASALLLATVGGILHDVAGYEGLYIFTGCIAVMALLLIVRLPEPRKVEVG
jgi:MFS family permease